MTTGATIPTLCDKCAGSLTFPADSNTRRCRRHRLAKAAEIEPTGDRAYGLKSLSQKTTASNHYFVDVITKMRFCIYRSTVVDYWLLSRGYYFGSL